MTRSVPTAFALMLAAAVAAVGVAAFAQRTQNGAASSPDPAPAESISAPAVLGAVQNGDAQSEGTEDSRSIRSGSLSISASGKTNPGTVKEDKIPEIEVDSTNIRLIPRSSVQPIRESRRELKLTSSLPESSLTERISDKDSDTVEVWRPAFSVQGTRGIRLDAFAVSPDGTVLAIAERTGTAAGPNGTRIVLIDTSSWQVIRTFTTDRLLKKLAFSPGRDILTAVAFPQAPLKQDFGILHFDLRKGEPGPFEKLPFPFNETISPDRIALLATSNEVFCSGFFGAKVFRVPYDLDGAASANYSAFDTVAPASALSLTPDGRSIAAASQKAIEYFSLGGKPGETRRQSITTLELGWTPVALHFLGSAQTDFLLCPAFREDSPPVIMRSSIKESLDGRSAGYAIPMENGARIGIAFKVKGRIDVLDPASLEAVDSVILEQLRPETAGDALFVFYLDPIKAFCVIDTNGNCFAAGKIADAKRWSKRIIWNGSGKR